MPSVCSIDDVEYQEFWPRNWNDDLMENMSSVAFFHFGDLEHGNDVEQENKNLLSLLCRIINQRRIDRLAIISTQFQSKKCVEVLVKLLRRQIKYLTLLKVRFCGDDERQIFRACGQLKSLRIDYSSLYTQKQLLCDVLRLHSPICSLSLTSGFDEATTTFCDLVATKKTLRKLYVADLSNEKTRALCAAASKNSQLTDLEIHGGSFLESSFFSSFASLSAPTVPFIALQTLRMKHSCSSCQLDISVPELPNLKRLDLSECFHLRDFRLGKNKTALRHLDLTDTNLSPQSLLDLLEDTNYNYQLREILVSFYFGGKHFADEQERYAVKDAMLLNTGPAFTLPPLGTGEEVVTRNWLVNSLLRRDLGRILVDVSLTLCSFFPPYVLLEIFYWVLALRAEGAVAMMMQKDSKKNKIEYRAAIEVMLKRREKQIVDIIERVYDRRYQNEQFSEN